jgi:ribosome-associated protein
MTKPIEIPDSEIKFSYIRSPGPGGQNVNKVATGVVLRFDVAASQVFTETQRELLLTKLAHKLTLKGVLIIKAIRYRTQPQNKNDALRRLEVIIENGLKVAKKRKKTKPTRSSTEKRLNKKKLHSNNKSLRGKKPPLHD